ncbi:hypothetical protein HanXRQr2_Chr09g0378021 [Helianthus annuus]|uniref:Uncharacterized protein n=1 Tax=Helianthus annuus TaxID=4232 RepID=A0A9K3N7T3_HELAN|nr:hypothetical protein HanXRQr2_Chr09g0378021 [Helianthus annuus]KAJ0525282.1 hypothetical protein HanHA300_Chr09g0310231 [Helianthus annuus]KAJ0892315.1 hypothetical protein HanPSC8_Chr09g0364431 [Helianthus annuus]
MEVLVQSEFRMDTPSTSSIQESIPVQTETHVSSPQQPPKTVEEPGSTTKKIPSPTPQGSSQGFPKVPSNLDGGPTSLDDVGYIPFFNDEKVDVLAKKVAELEKAKAETEEKHKQVEAKNVVLKNEIFAMNEGLLDLEAGNNALNEMINELLSTNCDLNDAHTTMSNANEIMQKELEDLRADKENKKEAEEAAEAAKDKGKGKATEEETVKASEDALESSSQREQQPNVEVNVENALVLAHQFVLVGEAKRVSYSREDNARRIEVERRRLKAKQAKKAQIVKKVNKENDDVDEEMMI